MISIKLHGRAASEVWFIVKSFSDIKKIAASKYFFTVLHHDPRKVEEWEKILLRA